MLICSLLLECSRSAAESGVSSDFVAFSGTPGLGFASDLAVGRTIPKMALFLLVLET